MKKRKNMKNLTGYWVNKRSGTIHHVSQHTDWRGNPLYGLLAVILGGREIITSEVMLFRGFKKNMNLFVRIQQMSFMLMC